MVRITLLLAACFAMISACANKPNEADVWAIVEARNATWAQNDRDGHMAIYHPDFLRWSIGSDRLLTKDSFGSLWDTIKSNEVVKRLEIIPKYIQFYADGKVAVAHYTIDEEYQWTGEDTETRTKGEILKGNLRFSDVYVFQKGTWLYVGGHRDGMALSPPEPPL
ncbi:nuclear transport factor 2 family protein [Henriciella mobilis]|uniref:nuclear transport factor 2 family protein n=1 Tax=Henriciella mobilis TaxID=2305467 RepID=UPI000E670B8B|nr:nuclear transport factor 2 family protein [Henriciella mobilis]RIJ14342.1 nuclear transport factor 2 family protein [Henriciella mobilis]RIJ19830.1 nuclear transport factor 2 family protein [Henriciella mobilis]